MIETIRGLYIVEDDAREQGLDTPARAALRKQRSVPILERLKSEITALRASALPASQAAEACNYALGNWGPLTRYLDHGIVEIDNNWAENAIRPFALGRKNWLHIGSEAAGPKVAAIVSIFTTCKRLEIDVRASPRRARETPGMADQPRRRVDSRRVEGRARRSLKFSISKSSSAHRVRRHGARQTVTV